MAYTVAQIQAQPTSSPIKDIGATGYGVGLDGVSKFKKVDLENWWWQPDRLADPTQTNTDETSFPLTGGTFPYRTFVPRESVPGLASDTYVITFHGQHHRMISFKTKLTGTFTLKFKIIAGGHNPSPDHNHEIYSHSSSGADAHLNPGAGFSHSNWEWTDFHFEAQKVKVSYNTGSYQNSGTWTTIRELHARNGESPDFSTESFTQVEVTYTLPADAYIGIVQLGGGSVSHYCAWAIADVTLTYATPSLPAYNPVAVSNFTTHWTQMQKILNGGIESSDISTTPWLETYHLKPMRFFGSPAPRVEAISGDVHYRFERTVSMLYDGQGEEFMPVHGLATTIHVAPPFHDTSVTALVRCNFYAEESDSGAAFGRERDDLCDFALFVIQGNATPQQVRGSLRNLYQEVDGLFIGKKNISMINRVDLSVGINHVYVGIRFSNQKTDRGRAHIARKSFVVDVKYL